MTHPTCSAKEANLVDQLHEHLQSLRKEHPTLQQLDMGCFCKPEECHVDFLIRSVIQRFPELYRN